MSEIWSCKKEEVILADIHNKVKMELKKMEALWYNLLDR